MTGFWCASEGGVRGALPVPATRSVPVAGLLSSGRSLSARNPYKHIPALSTVCTLLPGVNKISFSDRLAQTAGKLHD